MKKLSITSQVGESMEEMLQRYFNLFCGPLFNLVIKALIALCGLDGSTTSASTKAA